MSAKSWHLSVMPMILLCLTIMTKGRFCGLNSRYAFRFSRMEKSQKTYLIGFLYSISENKLVPFLYLICEYVLKSPAIIT